jgi:nucleoside phosphorylase
MTDDARHDANPKRYFDAIVVIPLEEEFETALSYCTVVEDLSNSNHIRFSISIPNAPLDILLIKQAMMGKTACQSAVLDCLTDFDTGVLFCVGIAGALSTDIDIGDICYSGSIIDVTDNAKTVDTSKTKQDTTLSPFIYYSPRELTIPLMLDRLLPDSKSEHDAWLNACKETAQRLLPSEFHGRNGKNIGRPIVKEGAIACGQVSGSLEYNKKLKGIDRKVLAIETESGGLFSIASQRGIPAVTIRGISDYADVDKTRLERDTGNNARKLAAANACSFLVHQMGTQRLRAYLGARRAKRPNNEPPLPLLATPIVDKVEAALIRLNEDIGTRSRELSAGYTPHSPSYRLPVPRIRILDTRSGDPEAIERQPVEVRDALKSARILTLQVPREYPDLSLSWIIANDLLSSQINEKQLIPCVVEANTLQKPRFGIAELIDPEILRLTHVENALLVFIIDDFKFVSRSRLEFLHEQIRCWPDAKFIVLTHGKGSIVLESATTNAASTAEVGELSFREMAYFVQKTFEMTAPASEVVAARLYETFRKYSVPVHPSYFAGIPRNMLRALLQANRRAELIELAVAGYLSFVVAEDVGPVSLSRTTREKFLTELAYEIKVEAREFTEAALTTYAESFAKKFDYPISPARFVALFIEKGILHRDANDRVQFTLPFMESYLLAKRFTEDPSDVDKYFTLRAEEFDHRSFTLYAEMGVSETIIENISRQLDRSIEQLAARDGGESILLDTAFCPPLLARQERLRAIQHMLRQAEDDVRNERDQSREKQRLLDTTDSIRSSLAARRDAAQDGSSNVNDENKVEDEAAAVWVVAVSLLGAGAERLEATTKRELVGKTVTLAQLIIDKWTRAARDTDYQTIKDELLNDEKFIKNLAKSGTSQDIEHAEVIVERLVDLCEYVMLISPIAKVLSYLCEEARDNVLAESIVNTGVDGELNELIQNMWLSDINPTRGRAGLLRSIRSLPRSIFLRSAITNYIMARVYWRHWRKGDRLILLNAADESLRGVGVQYKTSELQRRIEKLRDTEECDL